jgi:hypothetical protein
MPVASKAHEWAASHSGPYHIASIRHVTYEGRPESKDCLAIKKNKQNKNKKFNASLQTLSYFYT